ncbi:hypothetical protein CLIB1423_06S02058 [[Candida] railenensis]|uniref:Uncharacterized protein n=1 Tax=[Candida] railenensis TaxID=45579 RepID=A0A9P0QP09_9ASCO|nr:hypothetical protein CLIB1423_06S02058 [[Candida] railenensis]
MSGLVSRWATDETLVKEAEVQDKKASNHSSPRKSKQVHNQKDSIENPKPLVSRWATDNTEERKALQASPAKNGYKKNNVGNKKRHPNENENTRDVVRKAGNKQEEEEKLGPMTNAAKSFAARLSDIKINDTGKKTENSSRGLSGGPPPKGPRGQSRKQTARPGAPKNNEDAWEDANEEEPEEVDRDEGPLPPMSKAGQSLASRLGLMNPSLNTSKASPAPTSSNKRDSVPKSVQSDSKYLTPRQKKLQVEKENRARKEREKQERKKILDEEEKQKQQKLKQEVSDMFSKLTDKHANWADIEDDDF